MSTDQTTAASADPRCADHDVVFTQYLRLQRLHAQLQVACAAVEGKTVHAGFAGEVDLQLLLEGFAEQVRVVSGDLASIAEREQAAAA